MQDLRDLRNNIIDFEKLFFSKNIQDTGDVVAGASKILALLEDDGDKEFIAIINQMKNLTAGEFGTEKRRSLENSYFALKSPTLRKKWAFIKARSNRLF